MQFPGAAAQQVALGEQQALFQVIDALRLLDQGAGCFERDGAQPLEALIETLSEEGVAIAA